MIGIWSLGMGITDRKTIELGLGFLKFGKTIGWGMGFGQYLGLENAIYTPPSGPSFHKHCTPCDSDRSCLIISLVILLKIDALLVIISISIISFGKMKQKERSKNKM